MRDAIVWVRLQARGSTQPLGVRRSIVAKPTFVIQFPSPASPDLMHRVLNFVEDVYRELRDRRIGFLDRDIDHYASGRFVVRVSSSRYLGDVSSLISNLLGQHNLGNDAIVTRADRPTEGRAV